MSLVRIAPLVSAALLALHGSARADAPDDGNGRFGMAVVADGVIRLDTRTGAVSRCTGAGEDWVCRVLPDERSAFDAEIGRLGVENDALKAQLAQRDAADAARTAADALPKESPQQAAPHSDPAPPVIEGTRKFEIPLPSPRDIDAVKAALQDAWRKLIAIAARMQGADQQGKI